MGVSAPVVEATRVAKTFDDGTPALAEVDLRLEHGEFVTLIGPSGCGKSTLLKIIAGLSPASAGTLRWWGGAELPRSASPAVVFVFQSPTLMPWASVRANTRLPLDLAGVEGVDAQSRVGEALDLVGLSQFADHFPRQLSGGMQMRASIARALVSDPRLLLMDEPFGALDEISRNRLDEDLGKLARQRSLTVLFVTHSIYEAVFLSSRVLVMTGRPGRIHANLEIGQPFPRDDSFRGSAEFAGYCARLSRLLAEASDSVTAA